MKVFILIFFILARTTYSQDVEELYQTQKEAGTLNNKGYTLLENGQYSKAILQFQEAIELDNSQIIYFYNLADACLKLEDNNCALEAYTNAKQYHPEEADLYMFTGDVYQNQNKLKEAISEYNKAIHFVKDDNPQKYLLFFNRGNSYLKLKKYKEAAQNYTKALKEFPEFYGAYANRGIAYYYLKRKAEACNDWIKASENGFTTAKQYMSNYCD
ncbi:tetratricopeptide repeat protein [Marivirga salinae]|uniref:Tetratricopeptide repeat protein n=1 Tax=Marivirga salinarum TaxID=3059078 RepID=A0AA51RED9_9BACT|nr:tetratricopeptide repeat protein [Marivirga sp. BDSF4-3]WMN11505.1 tetratricopeptide repeat protein [Marivirga sp. BDSF4-3]